MPQLGNTLAELFTRAGVKQDDPAIKSLLANEAIFKAEISAEAVASLEGNLMNETIALNKLKDKMYAEHMGGVDKHMERLFPELGFDADTIRELQKVDKTGPRAEAAMRKLKEKMESKIAELEKVSGKSPADQQKLVDEINALKTALASKDTEAATTIQAERDAWNQKELAMLTRFELMQYAGRLNLPNELSAEEKIGIAYDRVNRAIADGKFKLKTENGRITLTSENGSDAYDANNRKLDFKALAEQSIAPILKKAEDPGNGNQGIIIEGSQSGGNNKDYLKEVAARLAEQGIVAS